MTSTQDTDGMSVAREHAQGRFATLTFKRDVAAPLSALWQAWTAPAARVVCSHTCRHGGVSGGRDQGGRTRSLAL
jgi:hypothetical protein